MANSTTTLNTIDWESLRENGLAHLQAISGKIWTDYNIHDPGVTLLELLCYAITDLDSRLDQDIADIVTENTAEATTEHFFSPGQILTINPVTINDYRKLLIDLPGVKNAWLVPVTESEPALYYDKDNNAILYDYASGSERIVMNGLYRVFIEKEEEVTDDNELKRAVEDKLHDHRNLCEDFVEINIMEEENISVFSDIRIDEKADANEVMAQIYYDLKNFISPRIRQYSLKRMLQKGKTIEEIFTGPQLENGFIDEDELGIGAKLKELHTSDLIRIIMAHPEVQDVKNLFISNELNPDIRNKQEWALVVDSTKAVVMEPFNGSKIRMFKNETICPISSSAVATELERLTVEDRREIFDDPAMDLTENLGIVPETLTEYSSIAYKLPVVYGVGETGLPSTVSDQRRAQARQLRAYLLFFEQILVNYLQQLNSFKRLFAFRQNKEKILKSYFSRLLPEAIWKADFPEIETMVTADPTENLPFGQTAFKRRSRILDHLLAQFNEKFTDYALFGYKYNMLVALEDDEKETYYLNAKADFLQNYPDLSRNRNRAYNYLTQTKGSSQTDGLKNLIASKLGIDLVSTTEDSEEFFIVEHILFRPEGSLELDFISSERIAEEYQPDPYSYQLTFVIPKKAGRFSNSKFKELAYTTFDNETPAHIIYTVLEFTTELMTEFIGLYDHFLVELVNHKQGNSAQYNLYRNQLLELLGIGRPRLPVLHLDATKVSGTGTEPVDESRVTEWTDLSGNDYSALAEAATAPTYQKIGLGGQHSLRFDQQSRLKVAAGLITDDFTVAVVFKTTVQTGRGAETFYLITGESGSPNFGLGFKGDGNVVAGIDAQTIQLESKAGSPHLAIFIRDETKGEIQLYLDGVLQTSQKLKNNKALSNEGVILAPGVTCDVGEVIILDSVISGSRKRKLEEYLSEKWGIPLSAVSSIAKPILHLDADVATSLIKDEKTNKISEWNDLSQNGILVTQAAATLQPVYEVDGIAGLPAVYFNNTTLNISNRNRDFFKADFTIGIVYQANAEGGRILDGTATENGAKSFAVSVGPKGAVSVRGETDEVKLASNIEETHLAIISGKIVADKLMITLWLDGKSYTEKEFTNAQIFSNCPADLAIGRSRAGDASFSGKIGEIVFFAEALSVWDRQRLEGFLSEKWQIDISGVDPVAAPVLHLDAARQASVLDETGAVLERDTKVYQWLDLSDSGNHAIQNSANRRPKYTVGGINGLGAIRFTQEKSDQADFYDDSLNINRIIQNDFTIMAVFQPDATFYAGQDLPKTLGGGTDWTEGVAVIDADCSGLFNDFGLSFGIAGEKMIVMGGIGDRLATDNTIKSKTINFKTAHFITFTREKDNGVVKLYSDGIFQAQADLRDNVILNDSRTIKVGAFNSEGAAFHGFIGEIIIFDQILPERKRQQIEDYLSTKWQIPVVTLPVDTTGLELHLDASVAASITKDTTNRISRWSDPNTLSDIAATQTVTEYQPVYVANGLSGLPALEFNNSFLEVAPAASVFNDLTVAVVFQAQSAGNLYPGWDEAGLVDHYSEEENRNFGIAITRNSGLEARVGAERAKAAITLNLPHIGIISRSKIGGEVKIYLDGLLVATETSDFQNSLEELTVLTIGAIQQSTGEQVSKGYYHGVLAEALMFSRILTDNERQSLEEYFARKWQIDISGINSIVKPVLHLDAGKLATIIRDDTGISLWLDLNGSSNYAIQADSARQPEYRPNAYGLGAAHFDGVKQSFMTLKPLVKDDFTVIIVYQAENEDSSQYMPISQDSFIIIVGVDSTLSETIWTHLKERGYIDENGNVLPAFLPGADEFTLALDISATTPIQTALLNGISAVLADHFHSQKSIPEDAFTGIGGVDRTLSQTIWQQLEAENYITSDGKALKEVYAPATKDFVNTIVETAVINVVLAENWPAGVGLFDGNCAGERGQLNKRDFGILVGREGQLIAGIGVPDETDYQIALPASFGQLHIGVFTRVKDTGIARLFVDGIASDGKKIARNVSMKDSAQFTIGAVNTGGHYFTGDIAEIIVLDKVPNDSQLVTIQSYLARKWGKAL